VTSGHEVRHQVGELKFDAMTPDEATRTVIKLAEASRRTGVHVHLANAYSVALASRDVAYREVFRPGRAASLLFPDGFPIAKASKILRHRPALQQVRGPALFLDVLARGTQAQTRHFLLGSTPDVLERIVERVHRDMPETQIVGTWSPPFQSMSESELEDQDRMISASEADVVWVGLGTPKQDFEARRLAESLPVVAIAIGAAFDYAAGTLKEAPRWMQRTGLEWLFRLLAEPRRLWKRYLIGNVVFVRSVISNASDSR